MWISIETNENIHMSITKCKNCHNSSSKLHFAIGIILATGFFFLDHDKTTFIIIIRDFPISY